MESAIWLSVFLPLIIVALFYIISYYTYQKNSGKTSD